MTVRARRKQNESHKFELDFGSEVVQKFSTSRGERQFEFSNLQTPHRTHRRHQRDHRATVATGAVLVFVVIIAVATHTVFRFLGAIG